MANPGDTRQPVVAIVRHNLFKISEPFITQQAEALRDYRPLYLGRLRYGAGPPGSEVLALEDLGKAAIARHFVTRSPAGSLRLLDGRRPALIHAHFGVEGAYALPLADRLGIPLVTTFHGFDATLSTAGLLASPAYTNYVLFRRRLAARGALFLCASGFIRQRLLAQGFPPERTFTHYTGVDLAAIQPRAPAEETAIVLHVARLVPVKGTSFLIRAFARLPDATASLVIIGDGPLRRRLQSLAASLGIAGRVRFLGALPHEAVLGWMRRAAMLVVPSIRTRSGREEGLGMVTLEAAATGLPVIGSAIGGIPECIRDQQSGFLVPPADPDALAQRLSQLLADPALRQRMGEAGRAHVAAQFDLACQTAALETLYEDVRARS